MTSRSKPDVPFLDHVVSLCQHSSTHLTCTSYTYLWHNTIPITTHQELGNLCLAELARGNKGGLAVLIPLVDKEANQRGHHTL